MNGDDNVSHGSLGEGAPVRPPALCSKQQQSAELAWHRLRAPPTGRAREGPSAWPAP